MAKRYSVYESIDDPPEQTKVKEKITKVTPRLQYTVQRLSESPCARCPQGQYCENKQCQKWKTWFLHQWQKFNNYYNRYKDNQEEQK